MLKVKDINVYYGKIHALKNVSFEVRPGEVVALIGANGAGKSTTLKTVSGMMHSRTGSIEFLGEDSMSSLLLLQRTITHGIREQQMLFIRTLISLRRAMSLM